MSNRDPTVAGLQSLLRLFHLVSPALPVGAYGYSQGLEYAVHAGWVHDENSAFEWMSGLARHAIGTLDLPILLRLHRAWIAGDSEAISRWTQWLMAARETAELRAEEQHLGRALARVLIEVEVAEARAWRDASPAFATLFSLAATRWGIDERSTVAGYLWTWCENQLIAAIKLVPLGQSAGQRVLHRLIAIMPEIVENALGLTNELIGVATVSQALASAQHELQYCRLFRS